MFVKKFEGSSLEQALAQVKSEFGPNALILSTQQKEGKWFQRPIVQIMAASEKRGDEEEIREKRENFDVNALRQSYGNVRNKPADSGTESIRKTRTERYIDLDPLPAPRRSDPSFFEQSFLKCGLSQESSKEFASRLNEDYSKKDLSNQAFLERAKMNTISSSIRLLTPDAFVNRSQWVAMGVAGSGKTSLLVKLALYFKRRRQTVSLHGTDSRKVVGRNELATYARFLKVPFGVDPERAGSHLRFIDSPSLDFSQGIDEPLVPLLDHRSGILVLDATCRFQEMSRIVERAIQMKATAVAFTKLDLASQFGVIIDVLRRSRLPLLGASLSPSFKAEFKFFDATELAAFILKSRGIA